MLASGLVEAIRARVPGAQFEGIAGPRMLAAGCETLYPMERLSVMGLFEVIGRYLELIPVRRQLARRFTENPPDAFIGVDAPDFNLSLELALRGTGVKTVHFVSPSVWAWRRYRLDKIARARGHDAYVVSIRVAALRRALDSGTVRGTSSRRRDRDAYQPGRGTVTAEHGNRSPDRCSSSR